MLGLGKLETMGVVLGVLVLHGPVASASRAGLVVAGTISSPAGQPLPDVVVTLSEEGARSRFELTDLSGAFRFDALPSGSYVLVASLPGYEDHTRSFELDEGDAPLEMQIMLDIQRISESVEIQAQVSAGELNPSSTPIELAIDELDLLPLPTDRFQEAFPLVPGVVRDPEGRLSFNGARPSQSLLLVNGANATDPLTGEFAVELPIRAIEAVEVTTLPYSAEYGQVTAAVAKVRTRGGTDEWDVEFSDLLPKLNFRDGKIKGIRAAVPQLGVSGPIREGKLWFSQGLAVRFVRSRVYDPASDDDERVLEGFDTFTQLDWRMAERHSLTTTFSYFPSQWDNFGLDALTTAEASPDFDSWGWNAAVSSRSTFSRTIVETVAAVKSLDVAVRPKTRERSLLTPDGPRNNYFNILNRESAREELSLTVTHALPPRFGEHILKLGGSVTHTSFRGTDESLPVDIVSADGRILRSIEWSGETSMGGADVQTAAFVQDQWRPTDRLGFDLGVRYDYDRLVDEHQIAPRVSAAYALDAGGSTVIKGGFGVFYDQVPLQVDTFERFQDRMETTYGDDGAPLGPPTIFRHVTADEGLELPRSTQWNVEVDHFLTPGLEVRLNYRERRGARELVVERLRRGTEGMLLLRSNGTSLARELDVTFRMSARNESELFASYVKSRSTGDLNDFVSLYQNLRSPLVLTNERSLFDLDVPHRFLLWGIWNLPHDVRLAPGLEWRSGFPYTVFEEDYTVSGERNRGGRFPGFLSFDVRVTKGLEILGRSIRVGVQFFNLASHFNPRDVVYNLGSSRFATFLNSVDMSVGLRVSLGI